MSNSKRKSGRGLLYGEESVQVNVRVPKSKKEEILDKFYSILETYEKNTSVSVKSVIPKRKEELVKKPNPTDYNNLIVAEKSNFKKAIESVSEKKKVDMDALRRIASGEGLKGEFSFTKKKVVIDELYDFEIGSLPDIDDRVYIDKKSIAMVDKYNPGVYYVIWEGRNLMFTDKSEIDRFAKEYLILI